MRDYLDESVPPLRRVTPPGPRASVPIWPTLTTDQRQILLHALSRLLARRLPDAPDAQEVRDERNWIHRFSSRPDEPLSR